MYKSIEDFNFKQKAYISWENAYSLFKAYFKNLKDINITFNEIDRSDSDISIVIEATNKKDIDILKGYIEHLRDTYNNSYNHIKIESLMDDDIYEINCYGSFILLANLLNNIDKKIELLYIEAEYDGLGIVCNINNEKCYSIPKLNKDQKYSHVIYESIETMADSFHKYLKEKDINASLSIDIEFDSYEGYYLDRYIEIQYKDIKKLLAIIEEHKTEEYYYSKYPYGILNYDEDELGEYIDEDLLEDDFNDEIILDLDDVYFNTLLNTILSEKYGHKIIIDGVFYEDLENIRVEFDFEMEE